MKIGNQLLESNEPIKDLKGVLNVDVSACKKYKRIETKDKIISLIYQGVCNCFDCKSFKELL